MAIRMGRRRFLQLAVGGLAWLIAGRRQAPASQYRVGIGHSADAYTATRRAVEASGEWPAERIAGRRVILKPNLVAAATSETGVTTDPQVVRALADLALEADAAEVWIVESGPSGANFSVCGYDFFRGYDPQGRVSLVDLDSEFMAFSKVPDGMAYQWIYMPERVMGDNVVFVSVAKLKTHAEALASLSMKNLYGLPPLGRYRSSWHQARFAMHERGVNQTTLDLNLLRPIDFAVVDGIWGMEGTGPLGGTPVPMNIVVAGQNALAVDRASLAAMGIGQDQVQHLEYASRRGLGPATLDGVDVAGDTYTPHSFSLPEIPPLVEYPKATPDRFLPQAGTEVTITYQVDRTCQTRVKIVRARDILPLARHIRTLHDWQTQEAGPVTLTWDGRDDAGRVVPPDLYTIQVQATAGQEARDAYATGWVWVVGPSLWLPNIIKGQ